MAEQCDGMDEVRAVVSLALSPMAASCFPSSRLLAVELEGHFDKDGVCLLCGDAERRHAPDCAFYPMFPDWDVGG